VRTDSIRSFSLAILAAAVSGGCGYSTERPFPSHIETVCVEMLESRVFWRDLEFELTEALVKRIELDTPYRIADRKVADSVLSGEITGIEQRVLGRDFDSGLPREQAVIIGLRYRWKDLRTGEILVEHPNMVYNATYLPSVGESFETGGMVRGLDGLAEQIVESMETTW
jgi:hypothetical protein